MRSVSLKCRQPHEFLLGISTADNNFCCCLSVNSVMYFVLNFFEELNGNVCFGIIVYACGIDVKDLPIEHLFRRTDVSDAFK